MTFEQVKLGDVADMLSGFAFKSAEFLDHAEEGVLLVRGDNVQQGFIRWGEKAKKWRSDAYDDLSRYHLQKDDVILAMDRPIVGGGLKLAWIKDQDLPSLLVQRVTRIRGFNHKARTNFLRYVLSTPGFLVWCLKSKHQIMVLAARATDAKMVSALLCHTNGLGSSL